MTPARTALAGTAALCAAVLVFVAAALPRPPRALSAPAWQPAGHVIGGAFHVHTVRSDGSGTVDSVAAAAARAGLRFVISTDHGDATRPPDPPAYRSGVLCLDAVEISTTGGHYAALGLGPAPYPLGGDPADVVEDVARLGGFGVVTHPDSPKQALAWKDWQLPFDGLEWLNEDTEWRDESAWRLATALVTYPVRKAESVASLFDRPVTLRRWDGVAAGRRVIALAGTDAHGRTGFRNENGADPREERVGIAFPSYEASFRAFSLRVTLDQALSGRAADDAPRLLAAIRAGHVHTIVDAFASPGVFEFGARSGNATFQEGDVVAPGEDVVVLRVRSNGPPGSRLVLFRDGREVARVTSGELVHATNRAGAYRAEAWLPGAADRPMPWAVSNPIFVGRPATSQAAAPAAAQPKAPAAIASIAPGEGWHVEHDPGSSAALTAGAGAVTLRCELGRGSGRSQFAALAHDGRLPAEAGGLAFRASATAPMRVSVQVRVPRGSGGERWTRSVYLDATPREVVVPFAAMHPTADTPGTQPDVRSVGSVLFVVDRTHAKAGSGCEFTVTDLRVVGRE